MKQKYIPIILLIIIVLLAINRHYTLKSIDAYASTTTSNSKCWDQEIIPGETIKLIGNVRVHSWLEPILIRASGGYYGFTPVNDFNGIDYVTYELKSYTRHEIHICYFVFHHEEE